MCGPGGTFGMDGSRRSGGVHEEHVMKRQEPVIRGPTCGQSAMRPVLRTIVTRLGQRRISVPHVKVEECTRCGERLYDLGALAALRQARQTARRGSAA